VYVCWIKREWHVLSIQLIAGIKQSVLTNYIFNFFYVFHSLKHEYLLSIRKL